MRNTLLLTSRPSICSRTSAQTVKKIQEIKEILGKALGEVRKNINRSPSREPKMRFSDQSSESEEIYEVLSNLKKGYLMMKHSEKIKETHHKFVYLSEDDRYICWKSPDKEDEKRIEISEIDQIIKEGAQIFMKGKKIRQINRCVILVTKSRRLQLEASSEIEAEYFRYELNRVLKYWKRMHLNYKYNKL